MGEDEVDGWKRRVVNLVTEVEELMMIMMMIMVITMIMMMMVMMIMMRVKMVMMVVTEVEEGGKVLGPLASKLVQDFHTGLEIQVHTYILLTLNLYKFILSMHRNFTMRCFLVKHWLPRLSCLTR